MRTPTRLLVALVTLVVTSGCIEPRETSQATARASDLFPTVFRSTLDGRTRILTAQLDTNLWAAWDVEQGGLFELWRDGVVFDGAVYTARHGPQPTTLGNAWLVSAYAEPWRIRTSGRETRPRVRYLGHALRGDTPTLRYLLEIPGARITVEETPAGVRSFRDGTPGFVRRFVIIGLPAGSEVVLDVSLGALDPERDIETAAPFELRPTFRDDARSGRLVLREGETSLLLWLRKEPRVSRLEGDAADVDPGLALVEQNDCLVCHGLERSTVGPAFGAIAGRYSPDDASALARRVISGGSGVWGTAVMTPHEDLPANDARVMVDWILSLDAVASEEEPAPLPSRELFSGWGEFFSEIGRRLSPSNSPGDGLPVAGVHPSFELEAIRPPGFQPRVGGLDFLSDGRLVVASWDPHGGVFLVDGLMNREGQVAEPRAKRIAAGLAEPLGVCVVDDEIYVIQKPELTQLIDHDGDDIIDEYRSVSQQWLMTPNFHAFAFGLAYRDGFFYATLATAILPGGASAPDQALHRGRVLEIARGDGSIRFPAHGLRTPNGVGFGPRGLLYVTDNQGDWLPASKLLALDPKRDMLFFGSRSVLGDAAASLPVVPPVVWLPQGEIGNSPTEPAPLDVGPYAGQLIVGDVTHGGIKRVFLEEVGGVLQGALFRFSQGFEAGVNRIVWGPDGRLYVGGIGSDGNWGQIDKERFGLQRLAWSGRTTFEMLAVRARPGGFEIEFTESVAERAGSEPGDYAVTQWRYEPTASYGGPKLDEQPLEVREAAWSADRRRVRLRIDGLRPAHVVHIRLAKQAFGSKLWSTEAWYTLNALASGDEETKR